MMVMFMQSYKVNIRLWIRRTPLACSLQLLVVQLAFQLLRLGHLANGFVEVVLVDRVSVIFDGEQTPVLG